ncbi:cell division protein ZapA [Oleiphilus messinensis]|uniref:cell division protein ZapA n=1 Tax=Oleiphilus messinensis TaxID=141451 RepID=UPI000B3B3E0A|nr:cell division protein ZapA [Oleiphilus messinensis]
MISSPNTVEVKILDKEYLVACPHEAQDGLRKAAMHLDHKMREIRESGKVFGTEKIAVMAALNLTYELIEQSLSSSDTQKYVTEMNDKLDTILSNIK